MRNPTKNRVEITGYLAAAPEIRALPDGGQVATFVAYTKRAYRRGNQLIIERERHQLVGYGEIAHAASGLKTGMLVQCMGRLRTDSWKDRKSGEQRYATRIVVTELTVIPRSVGAIGVEQPVGRPFVRCLPRWEHHHHRKVASVTGKNQSR